jgi:hypothetical protein
LIDTPRENIRAPAACYYARSVAIRGPSQLGYSPDDERETVRFVVQYVRVEIHPSARRHGIPDDDIVHAIDHATVVEDLGDDPDRWLVIGPDRAANLLEVVVLIPAEGNQLIIHAMPLRAIYRKLLES